MTRDYMLLEKDFGASAMPVDVRGLDLKACERRAACKDTWVDSLNVDNAEMYMFQAKTRDRSNNMNGGSGTKIGRRRDEKKEKRGLQLCVLDLLQVHINKRVTFDCVHLTDLAASFPSGLSREDR